MATEHSSSDAPVECEFEFAGKDNLQVSILAEDYQLNGASMLPGRAIDITLKNM